MEPQTKRLEIAFTDATSRLTDLQRGQALTNERVAGIEATLTSMRDRLDSVDDRFNKVDDRFSKVDERFNKVDERFDKIDERLDKIDERFSKVDERFSRVDERFNRVDVNFADLKLAIAMLSQRMEDGFRSFHEKLEERPTKVQLLRWVVGLLLAVISVGSGVGAYLLRAHGDITAAEVIDAARGR
jgi:hypothetical protein